MIEEIILKITKRIKELAQDKLQDFSGISEILDELKNDKNLKQEIDIEIKNNNSQLQSQSLSTGIPFEDYKNEKNLKEKCQNELKEIKAEPRFSEQEIKADFLESKIKSYNKDSALLDFVSLLTKDIQAGMFESEVLKKYNIETTFSRFSNRSIRQMVKYKFNRNEMKILNKIIQNERKTNND